MIPWPFAGRKERLRREASDWIARLSGPHDDDREAFYRWYRAHPDHAATYDRLATIFEAAGQVRPVLQELPSTQQAPPARTAGFAFAAVVLALCAGLLGVLTIVMDRMPSAPASAGQATVVAAEGEVSRSVRLVDGSQIHLAPGSEVEVRIDGTARRLDLKRGEGRFTVAHEQRPFVVMARGTRVTALGTQFVVRLDARDTYVALVAGRIEVSYPSHSQPSGRRTVRLAAGEELVVPAEPAADRAPAAAPAKPAAMVDLDDVSLAEAIERVCGRGPPRIRLAEPALARLRVTGAFRAGDAEGFARSVAAAFGLESRRAPDGTLWLGH